MDKKEWDELPRVVKDQLAAKFGLTRSGENNEIMGAEELEKIVEPKIKEEPKDEKPKKKARKVVAKKSTKRSSRR